MSDGSIDSAILDQWAKEAEERAKLEELKRALWAADDAWNEVVRKQMCRWCRKDCQRCAEYKRASSAHVGAEMAILAHIREQRPKGER